jgi:hypothetical protein
LHLFYRDYGHVFFGFVRNGRCRGRFGSRFRIAERVRFLDWSGCGSFRFGLGRAFLGVVDDIVVGIRFEFVGFLEDPLALALFLGPVDSVADELEADGKLDADAVRIDAEFSSLST